jgi:hypothetical protein
MIQLEGSFNLIQKSHSSSFTSFDKKVDVGLGQFDQQVMGGVIDVLGECFSPIRVRDSEKEMS